MALRLMPLLLTNPRNSMYGDSEATIGAWFEKTGKRKDIFLATKFGYIKGDPNYSVRSDGKFVRAACEESLRILKTDWIDLCEWLRPRQDMVDTMA